MNPRASRRALIVASVPELTSRTLSIEGTARMISSASSLSASVGAPKLVPRSAACLIGGRRRPDVRARGSTVPRSRYSRCSGCHRGRTSTHPLRTQRTAANRRRRRTRRAGTIHAARHQPLGAGKGGKAFIAGHGEEGIRGWGFGARDAGARPQNTFGEQAGEARRGSSILPSLADHRETAGHILIASSRRCRASRVSQRI